MAQQIDGASGEEFLELRCAYPQGLALVNEGKATSFESGGNRGGLAIIQRRSCGSADESGEVALAGAAKAYYCDEVLVDETGDQLSVTVLAASLVAQLPYNLLCNENLVR